MTTLNKENAYKLFHKTTGIYITSPFGYRINPITGKKELHEGVDYGTDGKNIPVYPILDGKVLSCGRDITGAKFIYVYFPSINMVGLYYHLAQINIKKGDNVKTDTAIGLTGKTGNATGIHLHFDFFPYKDYSLPIMKRNNINYNTYKFPSKPTPKPNPPKPTPTPKEIKAGDSVVVNGIGFATSYGEGARTKKFVNQKMKVIYIIKGRKYGYALNQYNKGKTGDFKAVTAWFKEQDIKLV